MFSNEHLYTGRRTDPETGLQLNRYRYYHAALGRWVNRDPIGYTAGDMNLYRYVGGMPTYHIDPWGLEKGEVQLWPPSFGGNWDPGELTFDDFPDKKPWRPTDPLDFVRGDPDKEFDAATASDFTWKLGASVTSCTNVDDSLCENCPRGECYKCTFDGGIAATAQFIPGGSWVRPDHRDDADLLEHERYHAWITWVAHADFIANGDPGPQTEIACGEENARTAARNAWMTSVNAYYADLKSELAQVQQRYDSANETDHGRNKEKQEEWENAIDKARCKCDLGSLLKKP